MSMIYLGVEIRRIPDLPQVFSLNINIGIVKDNKESNKENSKKNIVKIICYFVVLYVTSLIYCLFENESIEISIALILIYVIPMTLFYSLVVFKVKKYFYIATILSTVISFIFCSVLLSFLLSKYLVIQF